VNSLRRQGVTSSYGVETPGSGTSNSAPRRNRGRHAPVMAALARPSRLKASAGRPQRLDPAALAKLDPTTTKALPPARRNPSWRNSDSRLFT
jgi:hypothetical protein